MNPEERMVADYAGTGVTVGRHPMWHWRPKLREMNVFSAGDLKLICHGTKACIAGQVIARQRPGTAHGFIFLSLEDETGIANAIVDPELYEANRNLVTDAKFLLIEGTLQNVDKVIHLRAKYIEELAVTAAPMESHDFHYGAGLSEPMTSPGNKQPPMDWWLENACRIAAFRLRQQRYISANTVPIREQVRDSVDFVRILWEEIEWQMHEGRR